MSAFPNLQTDVFNNPVAWREAVGALRNRSKWFWRGACALTALLLIAPALYGYYHFSQALGTLAGLMAVANVFVYVLVALRTITAAVDTVVRERRGQTWELLMLTGVSTWRVVLGKWLGTLRFMLRDYAWLFVLRMGLFFWWFSAERSLWQQVAHLDWRDRWYAHEALTIANIRIDGTMLLVIAFVLFVYGALEWMMSAAIGLAVAFFPWSHRAGVWTALLIRIGAAIAFFMGVLYLVGIFRPYPYTVQYPDSTRNFYYVFTGALSDNAMLASATLMSSDDDRYIPPQAVMLGVCAGILPYLALTVICLRAAKSVAYWQGVNHAGIEPKRKSKREETAVPTRAMTAGTPNPVTEVRPAAIVPAPGTANIFNLANPDAYRVEMFHYRRNGFRLLLRVSGEHQTFFLQFSGVSYLEIPASWQGANFQAASLADYRAVLQSAGLTENSLIADTLRLYVVDTPEKPVRFIAGSVVVLRELDDRVM